MSQSSSPVDPQTPGQAGPQNPAASTPPAQQGTTTRQWLRPAAVRLVLMLVVFAGVNAAAAGLTGAAGNSFWTLPLGVVIAALALWAYIRAVRFTERRSADELRVADARAGLVHGTGWGVLLFTVTIGVIALFGGYRTAGWGSFVGFLAVLGLMCAVAVTEELLFRGVLFRIVEELAGTWGALAISAALFGLLHLINPNATFWGGLAIAVEAGLMFGAAYAATRSLWVPIGVHLGWNTAELGIFGTTVSGNDDTLVGLVHSTMSGPGALTGGAFGPEASIVAVLVCAVPTVLFLRAARRDGRILPRAAKRA
ncbi:CPBP family intramembrane glutamic endopeptidase [Streptomyces sp. NPDC059396]|uniref:CPBP family intramembrane glutamic endopeptidase n=1 Tax=Streptomyces sp. NPDC059396 TaxID=3346819 RepID=UPI0036839B25